MILKSSILLIERFPAIPIHEIIFFLVNSLVCDVISNRKSRSIRRLEKKNCEEFGGKTVIQRVKIVGATRPLTSSSVGIAIGSWRWHRTIVGWTAFHVGWRDDLKFKARAARVVRSLTEYHDRCHGSQSSQLLRGLANFSPFFRGMVPHSLLDVAHADPIRRHKLARYSPSRHFVPHFSRQRKIAALRFL